MMYATKACRSRPVFISSTFRDMHAERDHLAHVVFPELEERLHARRHDLVPIDLRWGVETVSIDDQHAKELLVLKVCLEEIDRSRPFFIGLLGDRYGWVPPEARMRTAIQEAGFDTDVKGKSITALEIEFGVLASPDQQRRTYFYFREPLPYDEMDGARAAIFSDAYGQSPGSRQAYERLQDLKARIRQQMPGRVRTYQAAWDAGQGKVVGLEAFGRMVLEDLWRDLDDETLAFVSRPPVTWQEQERAKLQEFLHQRGRGFVGRERQLKGLAELATSPKQNETWGTCVVGGPGAGKSALLAELVRRLQQEGESLVPLAHSVGISTRSTSVELMLRCWIQELAGAIGIEDPAPEITEPNELQEAFAALLSQVASTRRVVLLLDGLDRFQPTPAARHVTWLPGWRATIEAQEDAASLLWPQNARLIATSQPCSAADSLSRRRGVTTRTLPPLGSEEARAVMHQVCARYHRTLHSEVAGTLLAHTLSDGSLAAGNPLWLHLALEELLLLDEDDFARLGEFAGTAEEKLHALLLSTANSFPPDTPSLYCTLLQRTEEAYGQAWARQFANLVAISRWGLREADLRRLLPELAGQPWDVLRFATLRRGFRGHLVQRGELGQWDFSHAQAREAVLARTLADPERRRALHSSLVDHLLSLPADDSLRQGEAMVHLIGLDDRSRAAAYYGGDLLPAEEDGATRVLAAAIVAGTEQEPNPTLAWARSLLDSATEDELRLQRICRRYATRLMDVLTGTVPIAQQIALISHVVRVLTGLERRRPGQTDVMRDLAASYARLGELCRQNGQLDRARDQLTHALDAAEAIYQDSPDDQAARDVAGSYALLGDLEMQAGQLEQARRRYEEARQRYVHLWQRNPEHAEDARNTEVILGRLGDLNQELGHAQAALEAAEQAYTVAARLADLLLPDNYHAARDLTVSQERMGTLLQQRGDLNRARSFFEQALRRRQELWRRVPDSVQAMRDVWLGHAKLGLLFQEAEDPERAERHFRRALSLAEEMAQRLPGSAPATRDLANAHHKLGVLLQEQGDLTQARIFLEQSLHLAEELHRRMPDSAEAIQDLALSMRALSLADMQAGHLDRAEEGLLKSLTLSGRLCRLRPESIQAVRGLWLSCDRLGDLYANQQRVEKALEMHQWALSLAKALRQRLPESTQAAEDLADSLNGLGLLYLKMGRLAEAQDCYTEAVVLGQDLFRQKPGSPQAAQALVNALLGMAQVLGNQGRTQESQQVLRSCREPLRVLDRAGMLQNPYLKSLHGQLR